LSVELYFFQPLGTNSGRVYLALLEKGVDFTRRELNGREFDHLQPEYLAINPKGQVPTLVHDGRAFPEGMIANEYIDEAFEGPPLRPADPTERWRMRTMCRWAENDLGRALMMIMWNRVVPGFARGEGRSEDEIEKILARVPDPARRRSWLKAWKQETRPELLEESHRRAREGAQRIDYHLERHEWVAGNCYSLADIDLMCFCGFMFRFMPELANEQDTPHWAEWNERMEARPAVRQLRAESVFPSPPPKPEGGDA